MSESELISDTESIGEADDVPQTTQPSPVASKTSDEALSPEEELKKAEEFKDKGNGFFKTGKYEQAID